MEVKVANYSIHELPQYETSGAAGLDLRASFANDNLKDKFCFFSEWDEVDNSLIIFSGGRALIPTDLYVNIPEGYEIQIRPRSGLALKHGITIVNSPGTIDSDYRGNIGIVLMNLGEEPFYVKEGDRIAQAVLAKVEQVEWSEVTEREELEDTERGEGGFGSTNK